MDGCFRRPPVFLVRWIACLLLGVFLASAPAQPAETDTPYPLPYAPFAVIRLQSPAALRQLWDGYFLQVWRKQLALLSLGMDAAEVRANQPETRWQGVPVLGACAPAGLVRALRIHQAGALAYYVLPKLNRNDPGLYRFLVRIHAPRLASEDALASFVRLAFAGTPPEGVALRWHAGYFYLADRDRTIDEFLQGSPRPWPSRERPLHSSLLAFLQEEAPAARLWVNAHWLAGVVQTVTRGRISLRTQFALAGRPYPTHLVIGVDLPPDASGAMRWSLKAPLSLLPADGIEKDVLRPSFVFADDRPVVAEWSLKNLHTPAASTVWDAVLPVMELISPESAWSADFSMANFRMLTGLHPQDDLLRYLNRVAFALWTENRGKHRWCIVATARQPTALAASLRRGLAWAVFLCQQQGMACRVETMDVPQALLAVRLHIDQQKSRPTLIVTPRGLVIAATEDAARQAATRLSELRAVDAPAAALTWTLDLSPKTHPYLLPASGQTTTLLRLHVRPETGALHQDRDGVRFVSAGQAAPLGLAAFVDGLKPVLQPVFEPTSYATVAAGRLRLFLDAQQIYKHLELGRFNGNASGFAPTLAALVDGVGADGIPLERMYARRYDLPSDVDDEGSSPPSMPLLPFARLARGVSAGSGIDGYYYRLPRTVGGKKHDPRKRWILIAEPNRGPVALVLYPDGRMYQRRVSAEEIRAGMRLDLPANPAADGWSLRP